MRVIVNWSDLFRSHTLRSCQFPVQIPYFAQVSMTYVVYSVTNFKSTLEKNIRNHKSYYENIMIFKEMTIMCFVKSSKLCFSQNNQIVFFIDLTKNIIIMFFLNKTYSIF